MIFLDLDLDFLTFVCFVEDICYGFSIHCRIYCKSLLIYGASIIYTLLINCNVKSLVGGRFNCEACVHKERST